MSTATVEQVETVNTTLADTSGIPARIRADVEQTAWQYLLKRRTEWRNEDRLREQSRDALKNSLRQHAIAHGRDVRNTVDYLEWNEFEDRSQLETLSADDESLCDSAKLLVRVKAIRNVRVHRSHIPADRYAAVRRVACSMAARTGIVPTAVQASDVEFEQRTCRELGLQWADDNFTA